MNATIKIEIINDDSAYEDWEVKDLADPKTYQLLVLSFGNGLFEEVRVVAETKAGVFAFVNLLERGGYRRGNVSDIKNARLYHEGDVCYPEHSPFIFVAPMAENGDRIDFDNYQSEVEAFVRHQGG